MRSLQVQMDDAPIGSLSANGLGYNNLLYMAVVLEHLKSGQIRNASARISSLRNPKPIFTLS